MSSYRNLPPGRATSSVVGSVRWRALFLDRDPVREAEHVLAHENHAERWVVAAAAVVGLILLATGLVLVHPRSPSRGPVPTAVVLRDAETSGCSEAVVRAQGFTWATSSPAVDRLRLPIHGRLRVFGPASSVFNAGHLTLTLTPAMPCTAV